MLRNRVGVYDLVIGTDEWKTRIDNADEKSVYGDEFRKDILVIPSMSNKDCPPDLMKLYTRLFKSQCLLLGESQDTWEREFIMKNFLADDILFTSPTIIGDREVPFSYMPRFRAEGDQRFCQVEVGFLLTDAYDNVLILKSINKRVLIPRLSIPKGHVDFDSTHYFTDRKTVLLDSILRETNEEIRFRKGTDENTKMHKSLDIKIQPLTKDDFREYAICMGRSQPSDIEHIVIVYAFNGDTTRRGLYINAFESNEVSKHQVSKVSMSSIITNSSDTFIGASKALLENTLRVGCNL